MPRFFVAPEQISDRTVTITGDDAYHISRALRMAAGEEITVTDGCGTDYRCRLEEFLPDRVCAVILERAHCLNEPPFFAHVYQALPKGEKLDSILQKAVECGASAVTTFESARCIVRVKGENEGKKLERRTRIAKEAAKQSGRGILPVVYPTCSFQEALRESSTAALPLFCYEGEETRTLASAISSYRAAHAGGCPETVSVMIGSEGGFSPAEAEAAIQAGMIPVGLGTRILRTETAASFVLACLVYEFEM